jgi:hypothetical protein
MSAGSAVPSQAALGDTVGGGVGLAVTAAVQAPVLGLAG